MPDLWELINREVQPSVPTGVPTDQRKEKRVATKLLQPVDFIGGVDGTRTRDPRRDRPVF